MPNPYHYGTPVEGDQFTGRRAEFDAVTARMRDGINVVLISPRRYGKTSLLRKASSSLVNSGAAVVSVNVFRCPDLAALAEQLTTQAYLMRGGVWRKARNAAAEFVKRLRVKPSVTFKDNGEASFTFAPTTAPADADAVISDVYALLAAEADGGRSAVLVLDEAQALFDLGDHLPALLKSLADQHPHVSLVLAGSKKHLMEKLVADRDAPLYGMAEHIALETLPEDVMTKFLVKRARDGGKQMTAAAAEHLVALVGPVPNDIQHLAYEAFDTAEEEIDIETVDRALELAVEHEAGLHADRYEKLAPGQRRVLVRLAHAPAIEPYSAAFARDAGLANPSSVQAALGTLETEGLAIRRGGGWMVADPFFAGWLRHTI